jgi:hypothetical protein
LRPIARPWEWTRERVPLDWATTENNLDRTSVKAMID